MILYHNPRCGTSRKAVALLEENKIEYDTRLYLVDSPSVAELKKLVKQLGISPIDLVRKREAIYKEQFKGKEFSDQEWLKILSENPKLIERPILVAGDKAVIGRPLENIEKLIS